jgi:hypothetical protein
MSEVTPLSTSDEDSATLTAVITTEVTPRE